MSQSKTSEIPLFKYLQENFDSTVVYNSMNNWRPEPHYLILSKSEKGFALFTYINPFVNFPGGVYPKELALKFTSLSVNYRFSKPDTNRYFLPAQIYYPYQDSLWKSISKNDIWNLNDDKKEGNSCNNKRCAIEDADEHQFYLITKYGIKELYFYAPAFYENCCPQKGSRFKALQIIRSFNQSFNYHLQNIPVATVSSQ
jgi:hypothetical protein